MADEGDKLIFQPLSFPQGADILHDDRSYLSGGPVPPSLLLILQRLWKLDGAHEDRQRGPIWPPNHFLEKANRLGLVEDLDAGKLLKRHGAPIGLRDPDARGAEEVDSRGTCLPGHPPGGFGGTISQHQPAFRSLDKNDSAGQFIQDRLQQATTTFDLSIEQGFALLAALHGHITKNGNRPLKRLFRAMQGRSARREFPLVAAVPEHAQVGMTNGFTSHRAPRGPLLQGKRRRISRAEAHPRDLLSQEGGNGGA